MFNKIKQKKIGTYYYCIRLTTYSKKKYVL